MGDADQSGKRPGLTDRRTLLRAGMFGASAIVTIRPALAQTAASVSHCQISVPDATRAGGHIAPDGQVVSADTPGAFAPAMRPFTGEEVKSALSGGTLPGVDYERSRAYTNYIRRLQQGTSGFTCYASLQMPRR